MPQRVRKAVRAAVALAAAGSALVGCQSSRSWSEGCPGPYSGLRYYGDQRRELPWDGKLFFTLDVPFSAIADTLLLPFAFFVEPRPPPGGFTRGCRWADPYYRP